MVLINPPSTISERYGRKDLGEVGGDMIPLGIACLAAYLREKGFGVGVLDCPTLQIDAEKTNNQALKDQFANEIAQFNAQTGRLDTQIKAQEVGAKLNENAGKQ